MKLQNLCQGNKSGPSLFILGIVFAIYYNTHNALTVKKNEKYDLILCDPHSLFAAFPVATGCDREKREAQESGGSFLKSLSNLP